MKKYFNHLVKEINISPAISLLIFTLTFILSILDFTAFSIIIAIFMIFAIRSAYKDYRRKYAYEKTSRTS